MNTETSEKARKIPETFTKRHPLETVKAGDVLSDGMPVPVSWIGYQVPTAHTNVYGYRTKQDFFSALSRASEVRAAALGAAPYPGWACFGTPARPSLATVAAAMMSVPEPSPEPNVQAPPKAQRLPEGFSQRHPLEHIEKGDLTKAWWPVLEDWVGRLVVEVVPNGVPIYGKRTADSHDDAMHTIEDILRVWHADGVMSRPIWAGHLPSVVWHRIVNALEMPIPALPDPEEPEPAKPITQSTAAFCFGKQPDKSESNTKRQPPDGFSVRHLLEAFQDNDVMEDGAPVPPGWVGKLVVEVVGDRIAIFGKRTGDSQRVALRNIEDIRTTLRVCGEGSRPSWAKSFSEATWVLVLNSINTPIPAVPVVSIKKEHDRRLGQVMDFLETRLERLRKREVELLGMLKNVSCRAQMVSSYSIDCSLQSVIARIPLLDSGIELLSESETEGEFKATLSALMEGFELSCAMAKSDRNWRAVSATAKLLNVFSRANDIYSHS